MNAQRKMVKTIGTRNIDQVFWINLAVVLIIATPSLILLQRQRTIIKYKAVKPQSAYEVYVMISKFY